MMKDLVDLKNIFSKQLPKMPKEYICKLMFDRKHEAIVIKKKDTQKIIGGICFRVYEEQSFAEIAFLAITSEVQVQGFGTRLMNRLKKEMTDRGIEFLMTYADNLAIQYFKKQGFSETIQVPPEIWKGYLKDYDGSTHMECLINPSIDYSEISSQIQAQKQVTLFLQVRDQHYFQTCFE
jgi:histone acetyltransferase